MSEEEKTNSAVPDGEKKEEVPVSPEKRKQSVVRYLSFLFAAAFVLMFFTFMMERRQHQMVVDQNEEQIESLNKQSVSAAQRLDDLIEENKDMKVQLNEAALAGQKWDAEKAALEEQMAQQEQSLVAMSWFWQVDEAYTRGKKNLCRSLIAQMEEKELVESLPRENATGNSRFAPYDRFMEIKEAVG